MAITWGQVQSAQGASVQLGLDFSTATQATSQTVVAIVYLRCTAGYVSDNYNTLVFYGGVSKSISNVNGSISAGQSHELGRASFTVPRLHGRANSYTVGARLDGYTVGTPSVTKDGSVPAAGYNSPARPLLYVTRQSDSRVQITWDATPDPGAPVHGFNLEQREDGGTWRRIMNTADGTLRGWTDTSVSRGHVYDYRVRAVGPGGESEWNTYNGLYMTPFAPASVVVARDGQDVVVTWANRGVGDYTTHVWLGDTTAGAANLSGPLDPGVNSFRATGLDVTKEYVFTVGHITPDGLSATTVSNTVRLLAAPLAPTNLAPNGTFEPTNTPIKFTWSHTPTDGTAQSRYEFRYRTSPTGSWYATASSSSASSYSRSMSTTGTYEWQVRTWGQDTTKPSEWSQIATVHLQARPSASWVGLPSKVTSDRVAATFTDSISGEHQFEVELVINGRIMRKVTGTKERGNRSLMFTALPNGASCQLRVRVLDMVWSNWTTASFTVAYDAPGAPTVSTTWVRETGAVALKVTFSGASPVTNHVRVERLTPSSTGEPVLIADNVSNGQTVTDSTPSGNGVNTYRVTAVNTSLATSTSVEVEVDTSTAPIRDIMLTPVSGAAPVMVRWDPERQITFGVTDMVLHHMAGRSRPVVFSGLHRDREVKVEGTILRSEASNVDAFLALVDAAVPVLYRDPAGVRVWGAISSIDIGRSRQVGSHDVSFTIREADYAE